MSLSTFKGKSLSIIRKLFAEKERKPAKITENGVRIYVSPNGSFEANLDDLMNSEKVQKELVRIEEIFNKMKATKNLNRRN